MNVVCDALIIMSDQIHNICELYVYSACSMHN